MPIEFRASFQFLQQQFEQGPLNPEEKLYAAAILLGVDHVRTWVTRAFHIHNNPISLVMQLVLLDMTDRLPIFDGREMIFGSPLKYLLAKTVPYTLRKMLTSDKLWNPHLRSGELPPPSAVQRQVELPEPARPVCVQEVHQVLSPDDSLRQLQQQTHRSDTARLKVQARTETGVLHVQEQWQLQIVSAEEEELRQIRQDDAEGQQMQWICQIDCERTRTRT